MGCFSSSPTLYDQSKNNYYIPIDAEQDAAQNGIEIYFVHACFNALSMQTYTLYIQVTLVCRLAQLFLVEGLFLDARFLIHYCVYKFISNINYILLHKQQQIFIPNVR